MNKKYIPAPGENFRAQEHKNEKLNWADLFRVIEKELQTIAAQRPRTRLPKEEQIRSCVYRWLLERGAQYVMVEQGYRDPDTKGPHPECDLVAKWKNGAVLWIEIKRGFAAIPGYKPAPTGWRDDIDKLRSLRGKGTKALLIVGLSHKSSASNLYTTTVERFSRDIGLSPDQYVGTLPRWRETKNVTLPMFLWSW